MGALLSSKTPTTVRPATRSPKKKVPRVKPSKKKGSPARSLPNPKPAFQSQRTTSAFNNMITEMKRWIDEKEIKDMNLKLSTFKRATQKKLFLGYCDYTIRHGLDATPEEWERIWNNELSPYWDSKY